MAGQGESQEERDRKLEVSSESEKCHVRMKHLLPAGFNQIVAGEDEEMGKEGSD